MELVANYMKILIDGYSLARKEIYGIHRYAIELLSALDKMIDHEEVEIVLPTWADETVVKDRLLLRNTKLVKIGKKTKSALKYGDIIDATIWRELTFPHYAANQKAIKVDLLLDFPRGKTDIITIYDCIPELFQHVNPPLKYRLHVLKVKYIQGRGIRNCKRILTCSECSKKDIQKAYKTQERPIDVIYGGWQHFDRITEDDAILNKLNLKIGQYFFSLGSRLYHKNAKWILAAAENNPQYTFVISGSSKNRVDKEAESNTAKNVIFAGYLSDSEVKTLMRYCKAFIQPSLYEGFGMPPIEAMSTGANCIVSNVASLPEIYGNSVWYIDPYDYENIDLDEIMHNKKDENEIVLRKYSWKKSAKKLLEIIQSLNYA